MSIAPLFQLMTKCQRDTFASLVQKNKDACWVVEGGFTAISETVDAQGNITPHWGKITIDGDNRWPGMDATETEKMTFLDALQIRASLLDNGVRTVQNYLTLSDSQWYKGTTGPDDALPHEKRRALSKRLEENPTKYIPPAYSQYLAGEGSRGTATVDIVLQHTFSPTFQHYVTNGYANLRKKKANIEYAQRFHHRMFIKRRGWLYLEGDLDGGNMKLFSGSALRAPVFEEDDPLESSVKQEGAIGITYAYTENDNDAVRRVNTHLCGSVSAGRFLWLARAGRMKHGLKPIDRVVTVHVHDKADDVNIDRKLVRGMLAAGSVGVENFINIVFVRHGDSVRLYYGYSNNRGRLSTGAPLHISLGYRDPETMDGNIEAIVKSSAFKELFDTELKCAVARATQALGLSDVRLLETKDISGPVLFEDIGKQQRCENLCGF